MRSMFIVSICFVVFASMTVSAEPRVIDFAEHQWKVREHKGSPGPNLWSSQPESVWVDDDGRLHLKIRKVDGRWHCAEINSTESFGYGEYLFQVSTNVEKFDPNVVVGLFTYLDDKHEIDIEFSRWGNARAEPAQFVIQPSDQKKDNLERFALKLEGDHSTHLFIWRKGEVQFESFHGHYDKLPSKDFLIHSWTTRSPNIPTAATEKLHLNLWLNQGKAPADNKEVEVIVKKVKVTPKK